MNVYEWRPSVIRNTWCSLEINNILYRTLSKHTHIQYLKMEEFEFKKYCVRIVKYLLDHCIRIQTKVEVQSGRKWHTIVCEVKILLHNLKDIQNIRSNWTY